MFLLVDGREGGGRGMWERGRGMWERGRLLRLVHTILKLDFALYCTDHEFRTHVDY